MLLGTRSTSKTVRGRARTGMNPKFGGVRVAPAVATDDPNWGRALIARALCCARGGVAGPREEVVLMDQRFENDAQTGTLPGLAPGEDPGRPQPPAWLAETRSGLTTPGRYLAFEQDGRLTVVPISREWTRIGRSLAADIRFDDATVSRRHALVASEEGGVRVLDDRSLNGIQVNGRRVEWSPLTDGDELVIGRHALYFVDTVAEPAAAEPARLAEKPPPLAPLTCPAPMADTIAVLSLKGGTGKTTTVRTLA